MRRDGAITLRIVNAAAVSFPPRIIRCNYRPLILAVAGLAFAATFWFASRYPQLLTKARHVGDALPAMAYGSEAFPVTAAMPVWQRIFFGAGNWIASMRVGMTFGILFGALLHTVLRYYPLKIGRNLYLNSLKGALIGVPAGVCANCSVPIACGVTRGSGRIEVALGFLFSSPNFNPVVVMMTFAALPLAMAVTKYAIVLVVPGVIALLERRQPLAIKANDDGAVCNLPLRDTECREPFLTVLGELARKFARNVWMLVKPTLTLMLIASVVASALLVLVPWTELLAQITPLRLLLVASLAVFMPVPIALDVMFAALLLRQGVPTGYVMLFAMTLGVYSIIPSIYLWREVSRPLAVILFVFFVVVGWLTGMIF